MNAIVRSFTRSFGHLSLIVGVLFVALAWGASTEERVSDLDKPAAVGSARAALDAYGDTCWTGSDAPKAELPGAALVTWTKSGRTEYVTGWKIVDSAFNEVLAGAGFGDHDDPRFTVTALCV